MKRHTHLVCIFLVIMGFNLWSYEQAAQAAPAENSQLETIEVVTHTSGIISREAPIRIGFNRNAVSADSLNVSTGKVADNIPTPHCR